MSAESITIERYAPQHKAEWDAFVRESKNGTFLLLRPYMDYHSDRFTDHSLLCYADGGTLVALLPAAVPAGDDEHRCLVSHPGLTYGGLVMSRRSTTVEVCHIFRAIVEHLRGEGWHELIYRPTPHIYHQFPAEEDLYALTQVCGATLVGRKASAALDLSHPLPMHQRRARYMRAAQRRGMMVETSTDFAAFWPILTHTLQRKYGAQPVHTLQEIQRLADAFPHNIHLLLSRLDGQVLSGAVLFVTDTCVHAQYLCSSPEGEKLRSNALVVDHIIRHYAHLRYFDFGTSADAGPLGLNESLIAAKEGYGCRALMYDTYRIGLT